MTCTTKCGDESASLNFQGPISAAEVVSVYKDISSAMESNKSIVINLAEASDFDTAGVQLLYCAANFAHDSGKRMEIVGVPKELNDAVRRVGLSFNGIVDRWEDITNG